MMSTSLIEKFQLMPAWLRAIALVVLLNATWVTWSVAARHSIAAEPPAKSNILSPEQQLKRLAAPPLENRSATAVPTDDPLMQHIRQHLSNEFPSSADDLNLQSNHSVASSEKLAEPGPKLVETNKATPTVDRPAASAEFKLLHAKLELVDQLSQAAQQLTQLAARYHELSQVAESQAMLERCARLRRLMVDVLSDP
ncbi:MAG: hypothetical protein KF752_15980 [Pirellulaceae bacterium]|nr:hypothetical protein [Pirellulaceae bacterium]